MQNRTKFAILDEIEHHKKILRELEAELEAKNKVTGESPIQPTTKRLKIKFWKAEKALAMQIVEQEGLHEIKEEGTVKIVVDPAMHKCKIYLRGKLRAGDFKIDHLYFGANFERDKYLDKITQAITDELFSGTGELKVGEMCEVWNEDCQICREKLLAILPETRSRRYITECPDDNEFYSSWMQARPISKRTEPTVEIDGEIVTYTWEEES